MRKTGSRDRFNTVLVSQTADITGYKMRYVYMVLQGIRENEAVLTVYMELKEGHNKLLEAVKQLVPFDGPKNIELKVAYETFEH